MNSRARHNVDMNDGEINPHPVFRWLTASLPFAGFVTSIVAAVGLVVLTLFRQPTAFETGILQIFVLLTGLWGSYILGRRSAMVAARELIRPYARSAFRRVLSLYKSMYNLSVRIESLQGENYDARLDVIRAVVDEQLPTGRDALEDWRDIIPDDVDEMLQRYGENDDSG